jgi:DNA-binding transcriptional MerR regulator
VTTWSISEAAAKFDLSQYTLRWYERIGLVGPVARGGDGRRRYSDADLDWLSLIARLRETGMPVREMQRYAELVRSGAGEAERLELLKRHRAEVRRALAAQRETLKLLDVKIDTYARRVRETGTPEQACAQGTQER